MATASKKVVHDTDRKKSHAMVAKNILAQPSKNQEPSQLSMIKQVSNLPANAVA